MGSCWSRDNHAAEESGASFGQSQRMERANDHIETDAIIDTSSSTQVQPDAGLHPIEEGLADERMKKATDDSRNFNKEDTTGEQQRNSPNANNDNTSALLRLAERHYQENVWLLASFPYHEVDTYHLEGYQKNDKTIALAAVFQDGHNLRYTSEELKNNKEVVLVACSKNGTSLEYASSELRNEKEVVMVACSQDGGALQYASKTLQNDKEIVLRACSQKGQALQHASQELRNDKEVVLVACSCDPFALQYASEELQNDKEVVLMACSQRGRTLEYASKELQKDKEVVVKACSNSSKALFCASQEFRKDKEVVMAACSVKGSSLQYASQELKNNKEVVLTACSQNGDALKYASEELRGNKEVVITATESKPESLKYALGGLNQDKDCLIKAGLWDKDYIDRKTMTNNIGNGSDPMIQQTNKRKIVLSTKFSLSAESSPHATRFTVALKKHPFIANGEFVVYSPNAFNKGTCDPNWTDRKWPCRGTYETCQKPPHLKTGVPQESQCCWRYSFRYQLKEAHRSGGFVIQVVDCDWKFGRAKQRLGNGQKIELEMARGEGVKIFRSFQPKYSSSSTSCTKEVHALVSAIKKWYFYGCSDMEDCNVVLK